MVVERTSTVRTLAAPVRWVLRHAYRAMARMMHGDGSNLLEQQSIRLQRLLRENASRNGSELHSLVGTFASLRRASRLTHNRISGDILEIGSSPHPAMALILLLAGARRIVLNNVVGVENRLPLSYAETLYGLMQGFGIEIAKSLTDVVERIDERSRAVRIKSPLLDVFAETDAAAIALPAASLDMIYSMSVLEHIREPRATIDNLYRLLRPGSWCFHSIDMRDHRNFNLPLEFLRYRDEELPRFNIRDNRLRASDYVREFEQAGFTIQYLGYANPTVTLQSRTDVFSILFARLDDVIKPNLESMDTWVTEEMRQSFAPRFQQYSLAELSATVIHLVCRKS
jgi:SAM-dependent methyltransferase